MKLIGIGYGNVVSDEKIIAIVSPDSAPIKRIVQEAKEKGTLIDATFGRKSKAVIITEGTSVVLSALLPETIAARCNGRQEGTGETDA